MSSLVRDIEVANVASVSPSVRTEQLGSHCTDFHEV